MILQSLDYEKDWTQANITLSSGINIEFPYHLDGGGFFFKDDFTRIIKQSGKDKYTNAFEWCAGFGVIGYEILGLGIAEKISFSDYYTIAIENCINTATTNNILDRVTTYTCSKISEIPNDNLWDLVVANPPWYPSKENIPLLNGVHPMMLPNIHRITVDENFEIHKEFYSNIRSRLTLDADLYILEANHDPFHIKLAVENGLRLVEVHDLHAGKEYAPAGGIFHFKVR
jgi:hypothetical protein